MDSIEFDSITSGELGPASTEPSFLDSTEIILSDVSNVPNVPNVPDEPECPPTPTDTADTTEDDSDDDEPPVPKSSKLLFSLWDIIQFETRTIPNVLDRCVTWDLNALAQPNLSPTSFWILHLAKFQSRVQHFSTYTSLMSTIRSRGFVRRPLHVNLMTPTGLVVQKIIEYSHPLFSMHDKDSIANIHVVPVESKRKRNMLKRKRE